MLKAIGCWLAFAFFIVGISAAAQDPAAADDGIAGFYVSDTRETASTLVLAPDGRFFWTFSMGAMDTFAMGRWTRDGDGAIRLDSEPPVAAPSFTLASAVRSAEPGLVVRLACDTRQAWQFMDVDVEYADGEHVRDHFPDIEYRLPADRRRRIVAVTLGSLPFGFHSQRFPVDLDQANVLTFGFQPNDLGITDFRGQRVTLEPGALRFDWRDVALHYVRERPADAAVMADVAELGNMFAARRRRPAAPAAPVALEVTIGEPADALLSRTAVPFTSEEGTFLTTSAPVDLRVRMGEHVFDAGRIGGIEGRPLRLGLSPVRRQVASVSFGYQDGLIDLPEAVARARAFRQWLEQAGFAAATRWEGAPMPEFRVVTLDGTEGATASDWDSAARMLADDGRAIGAMQLFSMAGGDYGASAQLFNARRHQREACAHAEWNGAPGREWELFLDLELSADLQWREWNELNEQSEPPVADQP